jgi:demethylmenaquinone methyltransferase/2-methoxy-6-polyprenyl-1,4-benzoquinol methylase
MDMANNRDSWINIIESLREIIPYYDLMNKIISFNRDVRYRVEGLRMIVRGGEIMLDAGSGPGILTLIAFKIGVLESILLDPLAEMHFEARKRMKNIKNIHSVIGVFEHPPFRENAFNIIGCAFSIRDSRNIAKATRMLTEKLKPNGCMLIVEIGKPENPILNIILHIYWRFIIPIIAIIVVGEKWRKYIALGETYLKLPKNSQLKEHLKKLYKVVVFKEKLLGGALIAIGKFKKELT